MYHLKGSNQNPLATLSRPAIRTAGMRSVVLAFARPARASFSASVSSTDAVLMATAPSSPTATISSVGLPTMLRAYPSTAAFVADTMSGRSVRLLETRSDHWLSACFRSSFALKPRKSFAIREIPLLVAKEEEPPGEAESGHDEGKNDEKYLPTDAHWQYLEFRRSRTLTLSCPPGTLNP